MMRDWSYGVRRVFVVLQYLWPQWNMKEHEWTMFGCKWMNACFLWTVIFEDQNICRPADLTEQRVVICNVAPLEVSDVLLIPLY